MQRPMRFRSVGRPSFTIIEILVVIALLGVLVALTAGTVMQVMNSRTKTNTEQEVRTVFEALDSHQRAVIDQANDSLTIPQAVYLIAGGDDKRAKVIWRKLQIKRHFPTTFYEALFPATYTGNTQLPAPAGSPLLQLAADPGMAPLTVFTKNIAPLLPAPIGTGTYVPGTNPQAEMGALLRLTLTLNRRGTKPFIAEEVLGPQAVADSTGGVIGLQQIVDGWSNPLAFFRFPTDNPDMNNAQPGNQSALGFADPRRDPQDPEGRLQDAAWNNQANWTAGQTAGTPGIYHFELLCHRVHDPTQLPTWVKQAVYMQPTIVSNGPNKRLGIVLGPTPGAVATVTSNFGMFFDPTDPKNPDSYNDDIFSYSLH